MLIATLTMKRKNLLHRWLEGCTKVGCANSVSEVRTIVGGIVAKKQNLYKHVTVIHGWWDRFRARYPHLRLRADESLAYVHAVSTNHVILDRYFSRLEDALSKNNLKDELGHVFNLDESGLPLQLEKQLLSKARHMLMFLPRVTRQMLQC